MMSAAAPKAMSSLVELAASNDVEEFKKAVLGGEEASVDEFETWYCRRNCSTRLSKLERTPLMVACLHGSADVVSFILELTKAGTALEAPQIAVKAGPAGALAQSPLQSSPVRLTRPDLNCRSPSDGSTALHCAAQSGTLRAPEIVIGLLRHGANKDLADSQGKLPLEAISVSPKLPHVKSTLERLLRPGSDAPATPVVTLPGSPVGTPPEAPSSPSSVSPDRSPKQSPSSGSSCSGTLGGGGCHKEYPLDPTLPDIKSSVYTSDEFRMYSFKIRPCSRAYSHDWTECPFVHPGENARRRDPRKFNYSCVPCPEFRKGACRRGDACEYAHGVFECWLHPSQYRTRLCKDGTGCNRRVCFFAHTSEELRPLQSSALTLSSMGETLTSPGPHTDSLPPPSPSSVLLMAAQPTPPGVSPGTPPASPSANSKLFVQQQRLQQQQQILQAGPVQLGLLQRGMPGAAGAAAAAAAAQEVNLRGFSRGLSLQARECSIPEDAELVEAAVRQQLASDMQAMLLADAYAKLSLSQHANLTGLCPGQLPHGAASLQLPGQLPRQQLAAAQLLQLTQVRLAAAAAAAAAAASTGSAPPGSAVGAPGMPVVNSGPQAVPPWSASGHPRLAVSLEETYGLIPGGPYDVTSLPSPLPSASFSRALNLASPRIPNSSAPRSSFRSLSAAEPPPPQLSLDQTGASNSRSSNIVGVLLPSPGPPPPPATPQALLAAGLQSQSLGGSSSSATHFQAESPHALPSMMTGFSTFSTWSDAKVPASNKQPEVNWGSPEGTPNWGSPGSHSGLSSSNMPPVSSPSVPVSSSSGLRPCALDGGELGKSIERDLDALWVQGFGSVSSGLGSLNDAFNP